MAGDGISPAVNGIGERILGVADDADDRDRRTDV
jgi:hypothetical protein